jgi:DNA-binding MarR family transcriptional regulator
VEILRRENIVTNGTSQHGLLEQTPQFVQYLVEVLARVTPPPPDQLAQLLDELDEIRPKDKPRHIANPAAFYRMSTMLYQGSNPTMGELSHALSVPLPTTTRMANWWVDNGFAQRLSDTSDRRVVRVALTDRGRQLHEVIENNIALGLQRALSSLTPREQATLLTLLRKMAEALREDAR